MPADNISYNPIPLVADGGPYDSRKLQNGRLAEEQKEEKRERTDGKNTLG